MKNLGNIEFIYAKEIIISFIAISWYPGTLGIFKEKPDIN